MMAVVSDLGQAQPVISGTGGDYTHMTKETAYTISYLPNEFLSANRRFSVKTDVFSLGVVC